MTKTVEFADKIMILWESMKIDCSRKLFTIDGSLYRDKYIQLLKYNLSKTLMKMKFFNMIEIHIIDHL